MEFSIMQLEIFKKSVHITPRVFVHNDGDTEFKNFVLSPSVDAGRDTLYASSVFLLTKEGWIYFYSLRSYICTVVIIAR